MIDIIRNIHLDVIKETDNFLNKLILINKMKKKIALIFGITGQDGSYLAKFLIKKITLLLELQEIKVVKILIG